MSLTEQNVQELEKLTEAQRRQALDFTIVLEETALGTPGEVLIELAHQLDFSPDDIAEMNEAIKAFDRIDWGEWKYPTFA